MTEKILPQFQPDAALPNYSAITAENVEATVDEALLEHAAEITAILTEAQPTFATTFLRKEQADVRLGAVLSAVSHLSGVQDTPEYRAAYQRVEPRITGYFAVLGQNRKLLESFEAVRDADKSLSAEERRAIELSVRDFHLAGVALDETQRARFVAIVTELGELSMAFENAVLDATEAWTRPVTEAELSGIPDWGRAILAGSARERDTEGWLATLDEPSVHAVMTFAENRALRFDVYRAQTTRASDVGPDAGRFDNGPRLVDILRLRREAAVMLGFEDSVASSLATKMAHDKTEVTGFLEDLLARVRPVAEREMAELRAFARAELNIGELEPWDIGYASERMRLAVHAIDEEEIARHFPMQKVLAGMFQHIEATFGVTLTADEGADTWHPDVVPIAIVLDNSPIASLYLDLHARMGKRGGAWMDDGRCRVRGVDVRPIAFLTCNFAPRTSEVPVLLRHDDVVTLFHEVGHCLHHLLTEVDLPSIGGISGVEWDAIELPSQFHESFAWDPALLTRISSHIDTGVPLSAEMIAGMVAARDFQAGMSLMRQIEFSLLDIAIHSLPDAGLVEIDRVTAEIRARCAVIDLPPWNRSLRSFSHVFSGGYAAGYYSYLWAERLSSDVFEAFLAEGVDRRALGLAFRRDILARGASRATIDNFIAFRGREPDNEALLRQRGLAA